MKKSIKEYKAEFKAMQAYVNFKIDLRLKDYTPAQKGQITKYKKALYGYSKRDASGELISHGGLLSRATVKYNPRSKKNRKLAEKVTGIPKGIKLKRIPVPGLAGKKHRVRFRKNKMIVETDHIIRKTFIIDPKDFEQNTEETIREAMQVLAPSKSYRLEIGGFESAKSRGTFEQIMALLNEYAKVKKWKTPFEAVTGLVGYSYKNQEGFDNFEKEWNKTREINLARNKTIRRKKK